MTRQLYILIEVHSMALPMACHANLKLTHETQNLLILQARTHHAPAPTLSRPGR